MPHPFPRRVLRVGTALVLGLCCVAAARAAPEDELVRLEDQRRQAIKDRDFATLSSIYAPEFVGVTSSGQMVNRAELFRVFEQTDQRLKFTTDQVQVVVHGSTAIFFGRLVGANESGSPLFASRFSHVFVKRGESWVLVTGQSTPLPKG